MKIFPKDILIIDFEVSGFDLDNDEPIQVGLLLLDKDTLREKKSFISWIKPKKPITPDSPGVKWAKIPQKHIEEIDSAPSLKEVSQDIVNNFLPDTYILCAWNATFDFIFWRKLLKESNRDINAAQILDLWTLATINLMHDDHYHGKYASEDVFQYFGAKARDTHDALGDCRIEAMVLRKLLNS